MEKYGTVIPLPFGISLFVPFPKYSGVRWTRHESYLLLIVRGQNISFRDWSLGCTLHIYGKQLWKGAPWMVSLLWANIPMECNDDVPSALYDSLLADIQICIMILFTKLCLSTTLIAATTRHVLSLPTIYNTLCSQTHLIWVSYKATISILY